MRSLLALFFTLVIGTSLSWAAETTIKSTGNYEIESVLNLPYYEGKDADAKKHKLDLFLPKGQKKFPVLFFVHGGAWRTGDKGLYPGVGRVFAKQGIGVVVISYRLSPGVKHPAHIQDVAKAFAWTQKNIAKHGGDPEKIFVSGHSAGAHLVALLATDESYLKAEKLNCKCIKGVLGLCGPYTITVGKVFEEVFGSDAKAMKQASPTAQVKENHPPFLVVYAERDFPLLDKMADEFHKKLCQCKCESELFEAKSRDHITIMFFLMNEDDPTFQKMLTFIAKHADLKLNEKPAK